MDDSNYRDREDDLDVRENQYGPRREAWIVLTAFALLILFLLWKK